MSISRPSQFLQVGGVLLTFDEQTKEVRNTASGNAVSLVQLQMSRREVEAWLWSWAIWLDRDHEMAIEASDRWQSTPSVREALGMVVARQDWQPPWIRSLSMPRPPGGALKWLAAQLWSRSWLKSLHRRRHADFQRRHNTWLHGQAERWTELRADTATAYEADQRFTAARQAMQDALQSDTDLGDIEKSVTAALVALSGRLRLRHLQLVDTSVIRLEVGFVDVASVSDIRHRPTPRCDALVTNQSAELRLQRIVELGCLACLTVADFFGTLRTSRRLLLLTLADQASGAAIFESSFAIGTVVGSATTIVADLKARRVPRADGWAMRWQQEGEATSSEGE